MRYPLRNLTTASDLQIPTDILPIFFIKKEPILTPIFVFSDKIIACGPPFEGGFQSHTERLV